MKRTSCNLDDCGKIKVFCRIKPHDKPSSFIKKLDNKSIQTTFTKGSSQRQVFYASSTQTDIFIEVVLPLVAEALNGRNGLSFVIFTLALLFTYGITGSGKTHTMQGGSKDPGIIPRTLDVIKPDGQNGYEVQAEVDAMMDRQKLDYQLRAKTPLKNEQTTSRTKDPSCVNIDKRSLYAIFISFVEIYNNNVFDLLEESSAAPGRAPQSHVLREDTERNVYVSGCNEVEVKSADDAMYLFAQGKKRRRIGHTLLNTESSRSHSVFIIRIVRPAYDPKYDEAIKDKSKIIVNQLCLVDLAGSERSGKAGTQGGRLKEASNINNSLMCLRKCFDTLRENQSISTNVSLLPGSQPRIVPYRDSRLTHLFKGFFEGDGLISMIVCIHQSAEECDETTHVLKFAESSQEVVTLRPIGPHRASRTPLSQLGQMNINSSIRFSPDDKIDISKLNEELTVCLDELKTEDEAILSLIDRISASDNFDIVLDGLSLVEDDENAQSTSPTRPAALDKPVSVPETDWTVGLRTTTFSPSANPILELHDSQPKSPVNEFSENLGDSNKVGRRSRASQDVFVKQSGLLNPDLTSTNQYSLVGLRSLMQRRSASRQRALVSFHALQVTLRNYLANWMARTEASEIAGADVTETNRTERVRLEARLRQLETELAEQTQSACQERQDRLRQGELHRATERRLQMQVNALNVAVAMGHSLAATSSSASPASALTPSATPKPVRRAAIGARPLRPSTSEQSLVSTLSRQWENRLAQQQRQHQERIRSKRDLRTPGFESNATTAGLTPNLITATGTDTSILRRPVAFNPRHGRRSRSTGGGKGRWLEHIETKPVPLGTVFTPNLPRRRSKSVGRIELKDTQAATDYLLHHQEGTRDGGVQTKLYKGSIIPTAGGGSAVIFDDVEELKQLSPLEINSSSNVSKRKMSDIDKLGDCTSAECSQKRSRASDLRKDPESLSTLQLSRSNNRRLSQMTASADLHPSRSPGIPSFCESDEHNLLATRASRSSTHLCQHPDLVLAPFAQYLNDPISIPVHSAVETGSDERYHNELPSIYPGRRGSEHRLSSGIVASESPSSSESDSYHPVSPLTPLVESGYLLRPQAGVNFIDACQDGR